MPRTAPSRELVPQVPGVVLDAAASAGFARDADDWKQLSGGRSNRIWKIGSGTRAVICKLYQSDTSSPVFPNDWRAEARALKVLAGTGLAPDLLGSEPTALGPCLFYRYLAGRPGAAGHLQTGRALRALHDIPPPAWLRPVGSHPDGILAEATGMIADLPADLARRLIARRPEPRTVAPAEPVFLHGDPVPSNIIAAGRPVFIDWQCPAAGDPCQDLFIYISPAMQGLYGSGPLGPADKAAFLSGYGDGLAGRLALLAPVLHWRMAVHCAWRAARGDADYAAAVELELAAL